MEHASLGNGELPPSTSAEFNERFQREANEYDKDILEEIRRSEHHPDLCECPYTPMMSSLTWLSGRFGICGYIRVRRQHAA
jgi:hypothetical protein